MFSKKMPLIIVLIIIASLLVVFVIYEFNDDTPPEFFIFENISECEQLLPTDVSDSTVEKYITPDKDKKIKELSYKEFWGMKFTSSDLEYEIFAYEFADSDSALKYYTNVTGRSDDLPYKDKRAHATKGMFNYDIIVVYQNKAYSLSAPLRCADSIDELLANAFSYRL